MAPGGEAPAAARPGAERMLLSAAILSCAAALIHAAVIPSHFEEYWGFGTFFVVIAVLQLAWAELIRRGATPIARRSIGLALDHDQGIGAPRSIAFTSSRRARAIVVAPADVAARDVKAQHRQGDDEEADDDQADCEPAAHWRATITLPADSL